MTGISNISPDARLSITDMVFDGSLPSVVIQGHKASYELSSGTVEMLVTPDSIKNGYQTLFSKDSSGFDNGGHLMFTMDGSALTIRLQGTEDQVTLNAQNVFTAGGQTHIALTFGEDGLHVYANGIEVASDGTWTQGIENNKEPIVLGGNQYQSGDLVADNIQHVFDGTIHRATLIEGQLTSAQIESIADGMAEGGPVDQGNDIPVVIENPVDTPVINDGDVAVTSIRGSFENGSTIVIEGVNFGDLGPNVIVYDSFDSNVDKEGNSGSWVTATKEHSTIDGYSGTGAVVANEDTSLVAGVKDADGALGLEQFTEVFMGVAIKDTNGRLPSAEAPGEYPTVSSSKDMWLMMGHRGDNARYSAERGTPNGHDVYLPAHAGNGNFIIAGNNTKSSWWLGQDWDYDGWNHQTFYAKLDENDPYGNVEQAYFQAVNENGVNTSNYSGTLMTALDDVPATWDRLKFGAWYREDNGQRLMDDAYVATGEGAQARIVVTNNAVYEKSTSIAYLVPTEWSDGSVTATFYGAPMDLNEAYIHVFDAEGNRSETGVKVSATEPVTPDAPVDILDNVQDIADDDVDDQERNTPTEEGNKVLNLDPSVFDGTLKSAIILDHDSAFELSAGTLEMEITPDRIASGYQTLFSKDSGGYDDGGHLMVSMDGSSLLIRLQGQDNEARVTVPEVFEAGESVNLVITFGESGLHVYADGEEIASEPSWIQGIENNQEPIVIGANQYKSGDLVADNLMHFFDGKIANISLSEGQKSAGQIAGHKEVSVQNLLAATDNFAYDINDVVMEIADDTGGVIESSIQLLHNSSDVSMTYYQQETIEVSSMDDMAQGTLLNDDIFTG
ncbi:MAG: LamG-like jellyroll fold domain-containing protein [Methyloligellaceae bacterium]